MGVFFNIYAEVGEIGDCVYFFRGGVGFGLGNISICEDPAEHHKAEQMCEKNKHTVRPAYLKRKRTSYS